VEGLFLHASAVQTPRGAFIFLGHSTAGKSTIARLLSKRFPVIADDVVFLYKDSSNDWMLKNGKYRFSWISNDQNPEIQGLDSQAPILPAHFFRICKASEIQRHPLTNLELCRYLLDAAFEVDLQRRIPEISQRLKWFSYTAALARLFPGSRIDFHPDDAIVCFFENLLTDI
jgi:hypothetical protein